MKKTLIIGASNNPDRYAFKAATRLVEYGHQIVLLGKRPDVVLGERIYTEKIVFEDIDTVTLYLSARYQEEYLDYILLLNPKRVIFNPGTENPKLEYLLTANCIYYEHACTLVLLATHQY